MDKVIVITGASAGIGATLARMCAAQGAKVVLAARRKPELDAVAAECGSESLVVVTDVTKRAEVEHLRDAALKRFGRIDVWVNNAGRGISRMPSALTDEDIDTMITDNVKSALYGMQAVLPHFKERKTGQIVNVSSGLARVPFAPIRSAYGAAKSALNMLSACFRMELANEYPGIVVTVMMPGVVATDFGKNSLGGGMDSRTLPGAQTVEEATRAIVEVIEKPCAEAYSSAFIKGAIDKYHQDPGAFEAEAAARLRR